MLSIASVWKHSVGAVGSGKQRWLIRYLLPKLPVLKWRCTYSAQGEVYLWLRQDLGHPPDPPRDLRSLEVRDEELPQPWDIPANWFKHSINLFQSIIFPKCSHECKKRSSASYSLVVSKLRPHFCGSLTAHQFCTACQQSETIKRS